MRLSRLMAMLLTLGLIAAGCGWSPPGAPPPKVCAESDDPSADTVQQSIAGLGAGAWFETARGYAGNCRLHWVQAAQSNTGPDRPQQVLFFDRNTPLGPATPQPRPYIAVSSGGDDTVIVQYQWLQGQDQPCCPTGIATVRFQIGEDGKLKALDPIPNP
jgi:LppP/LprE lipoprotein